jgi:hypothetical protein
MIAIVPAFFGRQTLDKGQVVLPVLDAVFPFLWRAFQVKEGVDEP